MTLALPVLPYGLGALEPTMSSEAVAFHFSLHQHDCFERTAALVRGTELEPLALEELVCATAHTPDHRALHQYAAETWNHAFFWKSMRPGGGGAAHGLIAQCIDAQFGAHEPFVRAFKNATAALFGNGWLWLTWKGGQIQIVTTANAGTPMVDGQTPLLALDLWEHAYYLDHQNRRLAYATAFLEELVDWDFANANLRQSIGVPQAPAQRRLVNGAKLALSS